MSEKLQSAEGFAADLWNSAPTTRCSEYAQGWIAEVVPDIKERDRQQFEAGRAEGWRARGEADKDLLRKAAYDSVWEYYSPVVVGALKNMPLPAAQPASEPAKGKP